MTQTRPQGFEPDPLLRQMILDAKANGEPEDVAELERLTTQDMRELDRMSGMLRYIERVAFRDVLGYPPLSDKRAKTQ